MFAITDVNKEMLQKADSQLPLKHSSQLVKNDELGHGWTLRHCGQRSNRLRLTERGTTVYPFTSSV